MSFVRSESVTVTLSSMGLSSTPPTYFKEMNGLVHSVLITPAAAVPAGRVVVLRCTSTQIVICRIANPSTLGTLVYPRVAAHSSSGVALGSTHVTQISLIDERVGVVVVGGGSSGAAASTTLAVTLRCV